MFFRKFKPTPIDLISDEYSLDWKFGENSVADGYRAYDKVAKRHCTLWITRDHLEETNEQKFYEHINSLAGGAVEKISRYGCDATGIGYVALPFLAVKRLDYDAPEASVKAHRFLQAILRIEAFHLQGITCGNLCSDSFMLDSDEQVHFVGYPGGEDATKHSDLPLKYQKFIPPEMVDGTETSQAADVYALAVIGLSLFGVTFPDAPISAAIGAECVKSIDPNTPSWLRASLLVTLSSAPQERYQSVSKLLAAIAVQIAAQKRLAAESQGTQGAHKELRDENQTLLSMRRGVVRRHAMIRRVLHSPLFLLGSVCALLAVAVVELGDIAKQTSTTSADTRGGLATINLGDFLGGQVSGDQKPALEATDLQVKRETGSQDGSVATIGGAAVGTGVTSALSLGATGSLSRDSITPMTEGIVVSSPVSGPFESFQRELARAKEGGYPLTAEVLGYLVNTPSTIRPEDIATLLKVLQSDLSKEQRREKVLAYEAVDADLAYMLAASFSLDLSDQELFRDLIGRGAVKQIGVSRAPIDSIGTFALITSIPSARDVVFKQILQRISSMSSEDIWWLLETLALQRAGEFRDLIATQHVNQLAPGYHRFCLQSMARISEMEGVPVGSLLRCARQKPDVADVQQFSQWYDPASVRVLLATLLMSSDSQVLESSLDALSSKSTGSVPVDEAVTFISNNSDAPRADYGTFIGGLGLIDSLTPDEIKIVVSSIRGKPNASQLSRLLLQRGNPTLVKAILDNLGDSINPALLVDLLKHPDKSVRLRIIPFVKDVPLASSWQKVVDAYLTESDTEVKARYESEIPRIRGS